MTHLINLTSPSISLANEAGETTATIPPSGTVAQRSATREPAGSINGFPVYCSTYGAVEGLPPPQPETVYIVTEIVRIGTSRKDVVAPDTGPTCIRDDNGNIRAVRGFVR